MKDCRQPVHVILTVIFRIVSCKHGLVPLFQLGSVMIHFLCRYLTAIEVGWELAHDDIDIILPTLSGNRTDDLRLHIPPKTVTT